MDIVNQVQDTNKNSNKSPMTGARITPAGEEALSRQGTNLLQSSTIRSATKLHESTPLGAEPVDDDFRIYDVSNPKANQEKVKDWIAEANISKVPIAERRERE